MPGKSVRPTPNERSGYSLLPIFVLADGVNALAGVLYFVKMSWSQDLSALRYTVLWSYSSY